MPALPWNGSASVSPARSTVLSTRGLSGLPIPRPAVSPSQTHHESKVAGAKRMTIPGIDVSAGIVPVGLQPDGSLAAPGDFSVAGWYTGGVTPGEPGPAVIVGHVDSHLGPAVFFRLRELVPGQSVVIETANDATLTFIVERIEQHPRDRFPTAEIYGATNQRALRLITCGGEFDRSAGSYRDNIVVFAGLAV
ncbi:MAG: class F sortase [Pseudonocardiaceae bacterium]